jgi:hypothetical protein
LETQELPMREKNCYFRGKLLLSPPLVSLTLLPGILFSLTEKSLPDQAFAWPSFGYSAKQPTEAFLIFRETSYDFTNPVAEEAKKLLLK